MIKRKSHVSASVRRDLLWIVGATLAPRILFLGVMPARAFSLDLLSWIHVAKILEQGGNPYNLTSVLNWPPLWMQLVFIFGRLSFYTHFPVFRLVQGFLILTDVVIALVLYAIMHSFFPGRRARPAVLWAISLNPVVILLTCQHSTSDGLVVLWMVSFMWMLLEWEKRGDLLSWLYACLFLGLGILTKTVPLALAPLLAYRSNRLRMPAQWLGAVLVAGPSALGLSVLYVLGPQDIATKVLGYRAIGMWFGLTGLMNIMQRPSWVLLYSHVFTPCYLGVLIFLGLRLRVLAEVPVRCLILLAVVLEMMIPALGPGYSPTYIYEFLPFVALSWGLFDRPWKGWVAAFFVVAVITYLVEYALLPSHGFFLVLLTGMPDRLVLLSHTLSGPEAQTCIRLPLFLMYLLLLWEAVKRCTRDLRIAVPK